QPLSDQIQALTRRVSDLDNATQLIERHVIEGEIGTIQTVERLLNENGHDLREREDLIRQLQSAMLELQREKDTRIHQLNLRIHELENSYSRRLAAPIRHTV
ncbi:hypothetical protein, partial [Pseudomonas viridiflava]